MSAKAKGRSTSAEEVRALARRYPVTVRWSEEDEAYIGTIHGLAGDVCHGDDPASVFHEAHELALETIGDALREGIRLPVAASAPKVEPAVISARIVRKDLGLTQKKFSELLRIPDRTVINWENGNQLTAPVESLLRLTWASPGFVMEVLHDKSEWANFTEIFESGVGCSHWMLHTRGMPDKSTDP